MKLANVGRDLFGRPVRIPITTLSTIIAGLPGAGKSSLLRVVAAEASFEPDIALVTIDPKRVELGLWRPRAAIHATDPADVLTTLGQVVALIDHRTRWMEAQQVEAWPTSPTHPAVLIVVDELAELTHSGESKADDARAVMLRRVLSLGRACDVAVIAATQRPSADVVPTYLRSLFATGVGFRLRSVEDAKMALPGVTSDMPGPHQLPAGDSHRGRCYVQVEDELDPVEARIAWCDPAHARALAISNAHLAPVLDLDQFRAPTTGAPETAYARAGTDVDALLLGLLEGGATTHQAVADAAGITVDAARKRLQRLADAGRVDHQQGSNVWALTS